MIADQRVAIVTGAGKGIGRAYAEYLAARGVCVVLNNRRRELDAQGLSHVEHVVNGIVAAGGKAVANFDSVEDPASGRRMVEQALDTWGRLDILINNAGIDRAKSFAKFDLADFLEIFEVNFHGSLYVTHAAFPVMREANYGRILMSTSSAGLHGGHGLSAYAAAKSALIGLTRSLAAEGRSRNILVNAIAPYAATPMTGTAITGELAQRLRPERIAPIVAYLASERNTDVTGAVFVAGQNRYLRAAQVEGHGVAYDALPDLEDIARDIGRICSLRDAREFPDAVTAYRDFVGAPTTE